MKKATLTMILGLVLGGFAVTSCAAKVTAGGGADARAEEPEPAPQRGDARRLDREFNLAMGKRLRFDLNAGGSINITGWDREVVAVSANIGGRDGEAVEVGFREVPTGLEINARYGGVRKSYSTDLRLEVQVPRRLDIEIETMGGGIHIANVEGDISGRTMGGELVLSDLKGSLRLTTMGGAISLKRSQVNGKVETMGGEVLLEDVEGDVKGTSMGGKVIYKNVTGPSGQSTGDEVRITSMGGEIKVDSALSGANVSTMGGDIEIGTAARYVKAKTMGGDIRIGSLDGGVKATTMGGDVDVRMVGDPGQGDRAVELTSMGGDITLTVPDGLSMDIYIELAHTRNARESYQITSDFPLQQRESPDWVTDHGTPRKYLYGTGQFGGGRNRVVIKTINGNVRLKKG